MEREKIDSSNKLFIERARQDSTIMGICYHEYLGDHGEFPPENWEPSDEEVLAVAERADFE